MAPTLAMEIPRDLPDSHEITQAVHFAQADMIAFPIDPDRSGKSVCHQRKGVRVTTLGKRWPPLYRSRTKR
ncbi:hypothetical protein [Candidatus Methylacidithermus pantelleriae]|uniref:hypothetical protein n=1 Tax=Candidatus Methylacidithermus pantelleriae TaxID=2744239 RepID=UPI00157E0DB8|nr:hypothetical protein [Candidatus Methylacidithermus pantelleriae]